ncbi:MAG: ATP-binding protein [Candidatus Bathyarchaeota archaeon]|nr:ATP-binding protein [Candidatus Bathyarchaeota archaeon]
MKEKEIAYTKIDRDLDKLGPTICSISALNNVKLERGSYVKIGKDNKQYYIGQIIDGPYYVEDESARFEITFTVDLNAEIRNGIQRAVLDRPEPHTPVYSLNENLIQEFLGAKGSMTIGRLLTQEMVKIQIDSSTLTRHMGIFGTTGTGKSNTIQTMMEEAAKVGIAVLTFDVEGEYVLMNEPTDKLVDLLGKFGYKPEGIKNFSIYTPNPCVSRREDAIKFGVSFKDSDKILFSEVAGLSKIEQLFFFDLIERIKAVAPAFRSVTLEAIIERLKGRLSAQADNPTMPPYIAEAHTSLYSKLMAIHNLNMVDVKANTIKAEDILVSGKVSVIDFSDAGNQLKNIAVANILEKIFSYKMVNINSPKVLIVLEEAHGFVSKDKSQEMLGTINFLLEIARRGRKRGVCLGIVTQQPAFLPSELLELCNIRIMHRLSSTTNIDALQQSTGNVPNSMWKILPSLGLGQSIIASPRYTRSIIGQIRPVASKRIEQQYLFEPIENE